MLSSCQPVTNESNHEGSSANSDGGRGIICYIGGFSLKRVLMGLLIESEDHLMEHSIFPDSLKEMIHQQFEGNGPFQMELLIFLSLDDQIRCLEADNEIRSQTELMYVAVNKKVLT